MTLYKKKYRVESTRLKNNTYQERIFFVTICTKKKMQWFGEVKKGKMYCNTLGTSVEKSWKKIPQHFSHVELDSFVVMPDHVHGILKINSVETQNFASLQKFGPQSKNLGSVIRGFKIGVKKKSKEFKLPDFIWQPRFYDRVIRSKKELEAVKKYIKNNPANWDKETIPWHTDARFFGL